MDDGRGASTPSVLNHFEKIQGLNDCTVANESKVRSEPIIIPIEGKEIVHKREEKVVDFAQGTSLKEVIKYKSSENLREKLVRVESKDKFAPLEVIKDNITSNKETVKEKTAQFEVIKENSNKEVMKETIKEKSNNNVEVIKVISRENSREMIKEKMQVEKMPQIEVIKDVQNFKKEVIESNDEFFANRDKIERKRNGSLPERVAKSNMRLSQSTEFHTKKKSAKSKSDDKQLIFNYGLNSSRSTSNFLERSNEKINNSNSISHSSISAPTVIQDDLISIDLRPNKKKKKKDFRFTLQFGSDRKDPLIYESNKSVPQEKEKVPTPLRSTPTRETLDQVKQLKQSVSETRTSLEEVRTKYDTVFGEYKTKSWFELVTTHINLRSRIEDLEEELRELRKARKKVINNNQE